MSTGRVLAVCTVVEDVVLDRVGPSAIDKRATDDRVTVDELGLTGDHVCDTRHHGGAEQAVYAYAETEATRWSNELDRELAYGWFGENLRVTGIPVTDAIVGERWEVGDDGLVLETTIPRIPCRTFAAWAQEPQWVKRFLARADTGTYLRVVRSGTVGAGDAVRVVHQPDHGVRVRDLIAGTEADRAALESLLTSEDLVPKVRREATRKLGRV